MKPGRIEPDLGWNEFVVVRMLRRWVAAREADTHPLPSLVRLAGEIGQRPDVAITLHSLFQLTEGCLDRRLVAECCCGKAIGPDESAILRLIDAAPDCGPAFTTRDIPHGLPGALCWAAASARLALGLFPDSIESGIPSRCPFGRA